MRNKLLKILAGLLAVSFVFFFFFPKDFFSPKEILFKIETGEGSKEIAERLQEAEIINWSSVFRFYVLISGQAGRLQAGTYDLDSGMNISEITRMISKGRIATDKFTIIEGWTLRDISSYFEEEGLFSSSEFLQFAGNPLDPDSLEGYLFPDTYILAREDGAEEAVDLMKSNFQKKIEPYLPVIEEKELSLSEVVTMASLIEKEVQTMEDKKIVSGIFWKRIKLGYPLQSCASIAYIKGISQWRYSAEDTKIDSPYNTYLNYGLPPGPISNPGLYSIEAALYPTESPYLYYLSTPEGEIIYSRTLKEHNEAIELYLK
jgi:UPF0755 protein